MLSVLFVLFVGVIALLFLYDYSIRKSRIWRLLEKFPGEKPYPLIGNFLELGFTPIDIQNNLARLWKKHGMKSFRLMMGTEPMLFVCNPVDAKKILGNVTQIVKSDQQIHYFKEPFGNSLVQSSGEKWRKMRHLLDALFHPRLMEGHLKIINKQLNVLVEKLEPKIGQKSFDVGPYILNYALDVMAGCLLGLEVNAQNGGEQDYLKASRMVLPLVSKRFYSPWFRYDFLYKMTSLSKESQRNLKIMNETLDRVIDIRRKEFTEKIMPKIENEEDMAKFISKNRTDLTLVDVMLLNKMPNGQPIPEEWIKEEANLLLFAGIDTNLSTVCYALASLAKHPDLQRKVYEEQLAIMGDDITREPSIRELNKMEYLMCFLKESIRVNPTVFQFGRNLNSDVELEDGRLVAKGTNVTFYIPGFHFNPEYYPDPNKFDPDRFREPNSPYLFMPFGAGPRICIGMNFAFTWIRATLSTLIRKYELSLTGPHEDPISVHEIINYSKNGFKIICNERK